MLKNAKNKEKNKKNFYCKLCDYTTSKKSDWDKHLKRRKHLKHKKVADANECVEFKCNYCGKKFRHQSTVCRHSKSCKKNDGTLVEKYDKTTQMVKMSPTYMKTKNSNGENMMLVTQSKPTMGKDTNISKLIEKQEEEEEIANLKEEVKALKTELEYKDINSLKKELEHKDKIIDIYKKQAKTAGDTYNTNNINNTQNISINVFLNDNCKNAMNLTDFVNQIQVQLEDVMYQKDFGASAGIQNILQKQLENLHPTDRPIHCTDSKRMQFYVKEDNKWEKDTGDKAAKDIRTEIKNKSIMVMKEWEDANPSFADKPKLQDEYNEIIHGILEGYGDKKKFAKQIQDVKKRVARMVRIQDAMKDDDAITN